MEILVPKISRVLTERYERRARQFRWRWQQRLADKVFSWLAKPSYDEKVQVIRVEAGDIIEAIHTQRRGLEMVWHNEVESIVVGRNQFGELINHPMLFQMDIALAKGEGDVRVFGIKVRVVPWFDGVLLLPKVDR